MIEPSDDFIQFIKKMEKEKVSEKKETAKDSEGNSIRREENN